MAELYDRKQFEFHEKEAKRRFPGPKYTKVLQWVHSAVNPSLYVEIGVCMGDSLKLVPPTTKAIGIDPNPKCESRRNATIFAMPSDDFFARVSSGSIPDVNHVSLSFIDGLHTYDQALRELKAMGPVSMEEGEWPRYFVGTPATVRERLEQMASELGIEELIVNTIVWDHAKRLRSYELLAREFGLKG